MLRGGMNARSMGLPNRDEDGIRYEKEGENVAPNSCHLSRLYRLGESGIAARKGLITRSATE